MTVVHWNLYTIPVARDLPGSDLQKLNSLLPPLQNQPLTVFATGVEIFDIVVEADSDRGEAQLSLQPRHQPVVQRPGPLCSDHGADRPKHPFVADASHRRLLSLNLGSQIALKAKHRLYRTKAENL